MASKIIESLRDDMAALYESGSIDEAKMREFDAAFPAPVRALSAANIKRLREKSGFSQSVFAGHLNVSVSTLRRWEQGDTHPAGPALKLLNIIADKGLDAIL